MKKHLASLVTAVIFLVSSHQIMAAQWEKSFDLDLTATQASYSDSWTGGEVGSFSWVGNANGIFNKQLKDWFLLKNSVKFSFGQTLTQNQENKTWSKPVKSSDKIDLESIGLFTVQSFVEPFASFRFESQFLDASDIAHQNYINPMLLTFSAGIAKQLLKKEKDDILTRLGFALKHNRNTAYDYTNSTDTTGTSVDGGIESNTDVKMVLSEKLGYNSKLTVYKAFFFSKKDDIAGTEEADYWKAIDVNWENKLSASVSKYIVVSFYTQLLYDKQISKKGRLKETLSFGLTYKLL